MIKQLVKRSWKLLPPGARKRIVRLTQPRFTASAAAVVVNREGKVLLLEHLLRPYSGWGFPGGFIDRGETPAAAVIREVREETGIEITDVRLVEVRTVDRHLEFIYRARGEGPGEILSS
ncbi:MAG TPA: NUDIX hydrolase, partial [Pyrinomonadaceae bacterium]|nr:NUDIX hydrolase [Pyrinomonadaceae bacterium]